MPIYRIVVLCIIISRLLTVSVGAADQPLPKTPPLGEQWFSISMGDERAGFTRTTISAAPGGYEVACDSSARMVVMGFSRNAWSREIYRVSPDLSMKSFHVEESIDGKEMTLSGAVTAQGVKVSVTKGGKRREKVLKLHGKIYPYPLINIVPMTQGEPPKEKIFRPRTLDIEEVKVKEVTITVIGREKMPGGGEALHLRNDIYPMVDNDVWVDPAGNTLRESVRDDLVVTASEPGETARRELFAAALAGKEWIADFSMVGTDRPINSPAELTRLVVELSGLPSAMPLATAVGQKAERRVGGEVLFDLTRVPVQQSVEGNGEPVAARETGAAPDHDREALTELERSILGEERNPAVKVEKLSRWITASVADGDSDTPALETSRLKKGDSISRVRLYAALAEAAGLPTRTVAGLAYSEGKGFRYHVWAESFVGEWLPVDPCAGQAPADATHIKLTDSVSPEVTAELAGLIGHLRARIVEEHY